MATQPPWPVAPGPARAGGEGARKPPVRTGVEGYGPEAAEVGGGEIFVSAQTCVLDLCKEAHETSEAARQSVMRTRIDSIDCMFLTSLSFLWRDSANMKCLPEQDRCAQARFRPRRIFASKKL